MHEDRSNVDLTGIEGSLPAHEYTSVPCLEFSPGKEFIASNFAHAPSLTSAISILRQDEQINFVTVGVGLPKIAAGASFVPGIGRESSTEDIYESWSQDSQVICYNQLGSGGTAPYVAQVAAAFVRDLCFKIYDLKGSDQKLLCQFFCNRHTDLHIDGLGQKSENEIGVTFCLNDSGIIIVAEDESFMPAVREKISLARHTYQYIVEQINNGRISQEVAMERYQATRVAFDKALREIIPKEALRTVPEGVVVAFRTASEKGAIHGSPITSNPARSIVYFRGLSAAN